MCTVSMPTEITALLNKGQVIPAHPLALNESRKLNEVRQRALTRYYLDAGAGGIAAGVHTTQFKIRRPDIGLFEPVLELAGEEIDGFSTSKSTPIIKIAGVLGGTSQAASEARIAADLGYHAALLSFSGFESESNGSLIEHATEIAQILPCSVSIFSLPLAVGYWTSHSGGPSAKSKT